MKIFPEGFTIAALSPAGPVSDERISAGKAILESLGAKVKVMPHAAGKDTELAYLSGSDGERLADLQSAWLDPEISMLWAVRGGYGSGKLLDKLDWDALARQPKMVAGFSDITALHWAMTAKNCGTAAALPMFAYLTELDDFSKESLCSVFQHRTQKFQLPSLRHGTVKGTPLAGNLTVAASLCGTPFFPDTTGKILILEEVGEYPYRVDRTLNQLRLAGAFDNVTAVVFGHFTTSGSKEDIMAVLNDFSRRVSCPVFYDFPHGHELPFASISTAQEIEFTGI